MFLENLNIDNSGFFFLISKAWMLTGGYKYKLTINRIVNYVAISFTPCLDPRKSGGTYQCNGVLGKRE